MRTATSKTWQRADGSFVAEIHSSLIHYKQADGSWADIDVNLRPGIVQGYGYSVAKNPVRMHFAATARGSQAIETDSGLFSFAAQTENETQGIVNGSTITYPNAWRGADLRYEARALGIKEDIILKERVQAPVFRFVVNPAGLQVGTIERGCLRFVDRDGKPRMRIPPPVMHDARGRLSRKVSLSWQPRENGTIEISLAPNPEWLAQAAYPVTIDPSFLYYYPEYGAGEQFTWSKNSEDDLGPFVYDCYADYLGCGKATCVGLCWSIEDHAAFVGYSNVGHTMPQYACVEDVSITFTGLYQYRVPESVKTVALYQSPDGSNPWDSSGLWTLSSLNASYAWGLSDTQHTFRSAAITQMVVDWLNATATVPENFYDIYFALHAETPYDPNNPNCNEQYFLEFECYNGGYEPPFPSAPVIEFVYQTDTTAPTCMITDPSTTSSSPLHKSSNGNATVRIAGTASDDSGCGVDSVEVAVVEGANEDAPDPWAGTAATYHDGTHTWDYNWTCNCSSTCSYTIWARAVDKAGNEAAVSRNLYVQNAAIVYVRPHDPQETHNGGSWNTAWNTVQEGIDDAEDDNIDPSQRPEVWVAKVAESPHYYPENVTLANGVSLYGGFAGNEHVREERDWAANETVLDGTGAYDSVVRISNCTDPDTRVDGFVIQHGFGTYDELRTERCGGGVYCKSSNVTIANNTIEGNGDSLVYGGGIACVESSSPDISSNSILSNTGVEGAGIACHNSTPTISGNMIRDNLAYNMGGGITLDHSSATVSSNAIVSNTALQAGGGIYCTDSSVTVSGNRIEGNTARSAPGGGLFLLRAPSADILSNTIRANKAEEGGGVYCRSNGLVLEDYVTYVLANNAIYENEAVDVGGGLYFELRQQENNGDTASLANNTIVSNVAPTGGGAIYQCAGSVNITNTLIAFNSSGIYRFTWPGTTTFNHCDVYDNGAYDFWNIDNPIGTDGNIGDDPEDDPKLAARDYGNVHIQPDSPCVDAGDDSAVVGTVDVDGEDRTVGNHVDIGADESDSTTWPSIPLIVRVKKDGDDENDGSTWALAKATIGAAIAYIQEPEHGGAGAVWVKEGEYAETIAVPGHTSVYGGFQGNEAALSERPAFPRSDPDSNETTIYGTTTLPGSVVAFPETLGYLISAIDGCTITGGLGTYYDLTLWGGGVYCDQSSPRIENNKVHDNSAEAETGQGYGGGVACHSGCPLIQRNEVYSNHAGESGGGILSNPGSPLIRHNWIHDNETTLVGRGKGGGIGCIGDVGYRSAPTIDGNKIVENHGADRGGGVALDSSDALVSNNVFDTNTCGGSQLGGGGLVSLDSDSRIVNNTFVFNSTTAYDRGGAIFVWTINGPLRGVLVTNNIFYENSAAGSLGNSVAGRDTQTPIYVCFCDAYSTMGSGDSYHYRNVAGDRTGCLYVDPLLDGYGLNSTSPCIDQALDPTRVDEMIAEMWGVGGGTWTPPCQFSLKLDFVGAPRPENIGGIPDYYHPVYGYQCTDMGACERQSQ